MNLHRIDIDVAPVGHSIIFIAEAVNYNTGGGLGPLLEVAVAEVLIEALVTADAVVLALPVAVHLLAEGVGAIQNEENIVQIAAIHRVAEAVVGGRDGVHHLLHSHAVGAELVTPSQGGVGPVHSQDNLVVALTHPVGNLLGADGGLLGHRISAGDADGMHLGSPGLLHIVSILEIPADSRVVITELEVVAVLKDGAIRGNAEAVEVGPPEVVANRGIDRRETERVAGSVHEIEIASIRRVVDDGETRVGGGEGIHHVLNGGLVVAEAPCQSRVGLGKADDERSLVAALTHPVENILEGDGGIDRVGSGIGGHNHGIGHAILHPIHEVARNDDIVGSSHRGHGLVGTVTGNPVVPPPTYRTNQVETQLGVGIGHVVDKSIGSGAMRDSEIVVIGFNRVHQRGEAGGAVPLHTPCYADIILIVVFPSDGNDSAVAASTCPELDVTLRNHGVRGLGHGAKTKHHA